MTTPGLTLAPHYYIRVSVYDRGCLHGEFGSIEAAETFIRHAPPIDPTTCPNCGKPLYKSDIWGQWCPECQFVPR